MTLQYATIFNPNMLQAMRRLMACQELDIKIAYRVAKIAEAIDRELRTAKPLMEQLQVKYATDGETMNQQRDELFAITTQVPQLPISLVDLTAAKLSPQEILAIEWMLEEAK